MLRFPNCRAWLCQEGMSAQTSMACPNARSPHARQPFGLCRDGITHLIEVMKGNQQSRVNGMTLSEPLAIQPEKLLILPRTPCVYAAVGTVAGGARDKERLGMIIMIVVHAARSRFAVEDTLLLAGNQPDYLAIPIPSSNQPTERGNKNQLFRQSTSQPTEQSINNPVAKPEPNRPTPLTRHPQD